MTGTGNDDVHLLVVCTAERGLCGGFNSSIAREARRRIQPLKEQGKTVKVLCVGRKGRDQLRRNYDHLIIETIENIGKPRLNFEGAKTVAGRITELFEAGEFDVCTLIYSQFKNVLSQIPTAQQLIPASAAGESRY